jgi:crotonobetainyl-CoA:carnitine CoA-transferase CaiB-like acyl-CoA transferase
MQGMGGLMGTTGEEGGAPVKVGVAVTDIAAGMFAAFGIMVALRVRDRTGEGQLVDAAMLDCQIAWTTYLSGSYFATGANPRRLGSAHPSLVPYQAFKTKDGYLNIAVGSESIWARFAPAVGAPQLANDPRYKTNPVRVQHRDTLIPALNDIFAGKTTEEWTAIMDEAGVPAGPIYTMSDLFNDPQVRHRKMVVEMDHPAAGRIKQTGVAVRLGTTPGGVDAAPPLLGQHNDTILRDLGYSSDQIAAMKQDGAV